jgi:hypothetical protein
MPVQLLPHRALLDPDRMLREILAQNPAGDPAGIRSPGTAAETAGATDALAARRRRRRSIIGGALVAAAAIVVTAVAVPSVIRHRDTLAGPAGPSVGVPTSAPSAGRTTPTHPTTGRLALGRTATFEHFTVTVDRVEHSPTYGILVDVEVCVRSLPAGTSGTTTRVTWNPWTLANGEGRTTPSLRDAPSGVPETPSLFPRRADLGVGDCAIGLVPFNADEHSRVVAVFYANSFGDTAAWAGE